MTSQNLREIIASTQHEIWAHWMQYQFAVGTTTKDGSILIPAEKVERWTRQMNTPYLALTDQEQESDRDQADKIIAAIKEVAATDDVLRIKIYQDGDQWCALKGVDIQSGDAGFGDTPTEALRALMEGDRNA